MSKRLKCRFYDCRQYFWKYCETSMNLVNKCQSWSSILQTVSAGVVLMLLLITLFSLLVGNVQERLCKVAVYHTYIGTSIGLELYC